MLAYQDASLGIEQRAQDLLSRLTLREKVGQLNQRLYGFHAVQRQGDQLVLSDDFTQEVQRWGGLGTLYGLYRADPWSGRDHQNGLYGPTAIKAYNMAQRYVVEHSRFGIPMLLSTECPHGHQAAEGYLLPVNLGVAATFDPQLLQSAGAVCGRQLKQLGVDFALVSMLDILRDPRWGRSEECFGEDPYLAAQMARAVVQGIRSAGVAVVAKHLCAQGQTSGGVNASAACVGMRELRQIHLPAAKAACEAGAEGFMAAYNEIDGVPCHANDVLLRDILRGEYGFDGVVMADGCAIDRLDELTGDNVRSAALALESGVDISLWDSAFTHLEEAVLQGYVSERVLDEAVLRVLKLKFARGLFEHPYLEEDAPLSSFDIDSCPQSLQLAREGVVLLKNDGVLPLVAPRCIALIGPSAHDVYRQLGDYSPPMRQGQYATLLDGLQAECGSDVRILHDDGSDCRRAAALAAQADVTVLALGGSSSRFGQVAFDSNGAALTADSAMDCGENADVAQLRLPGAQHELFAAVRAAAKTVVAVLIVGRPYAVEDIAAGSDALLLSFYPGPWGGTAIAQALLGRFSPSGRLPVSFPRHAGQLPVYYNAKAGAVTLSYRDLPHTPLFTFGQGMGYSPLHYEDLRTERLPLRGLPTDRTPVWRLHMRIRNTGACDQAAVPMLFVTDMESDVTRRLCELKAFDRVTVPAGQCREATLTLYACDLCIWDRRMQFVLQPGHFRIVLRDGADDLNTFLLEV